MRETYPIASRNAGIVVVFVSQPVGVAMVTMVGAARCALNTPVRAWDRLANLRTARRLARTCACAGLAKLTPVVSLVRFLA